MCARGPPANHHMGPTHEVELYSQQQQPNMICSALFMVTKLIRTRPQANTVHLKGHREVICGLWSLQFVVA